MDVSSMCSDSSSETTSCFIVVLLYHLCYTVYSHWHCQCCLRVDFCFRFDLFFPDALAMYWRYRSIWYLSISSLLCPLYHLSATFPRRSANISIIPSGTRNEDLMRQSHSQTCWHVELFHWRHSLHFHFLTYCETTYTSLWMNVERLVKIFLSNLV